MAESSIGKADTVYSIFKASLSTDKTTRTEISNSTALSFVTVSKVVDHLIDQNILKQTYTNDKCAKRRSNILSVKQYHWIAVYHLSPDKFTFSAYDLSLTPIASFAQSTDRSIFIDDCLNSFIRDSHSFMKNQKLHTERCIGTGVIVPGIYDKDNDKISADADTHLNGIHIREFFTDSIFADRLIILNECNALANSVQNGMTRDDRILTVFLHKYAFLTGYIADREAETTDIKNFGILKTANGKSIKDAALRSLDTDTVFEELSKILMTLISTIPITKITICSSIYANSESVTEMIRKMLWKSCEEYLIMPPEVMHGECVDLSGKGIASAIRKDWFFADLLK